jgi:hypothetical protein
MGEGHKIMDNFCYFFSPARGDKYLDEIYTCSFRHCLEG